MHVLAQVVTAPGGGNAVTLGALLVAMLPFVPLVMKLLDFLKLVTNKDVNGVVTQLLGWALGVAAVFVIVHSDFSRGNILGHLNFYTICIAGFVVGSGGSFIYDLIRAIDNTNTAAMPPLLGQTIPNRPTQQVLTTNVVGADPLVTGPPAEPGNAGAAARRPRGGGKTKSGDWRLLR